MEVSEELVALNKVAARFGRKMQDIDIFFCIVTDESKNDPSVLLELSIALSKNKSIGLIVDRSVCVSDKMKLLADAVEYFSPDDCLSLDLAIKKIYNRIGGYA